MRGGRVIERGSPEPCSRRPSSQFALRELIDAAPARKPRGTRLLVREAQAPAFAPARASFATRPMLRHGSSFARSAPVTAEGAARTTVLSGVALQVRAGETVGLSARAARARPRCCASCSACTRISRVQARRRRSTGTAAGCASRAAGRRGVRAAAGSARLVSRAVRPAWLLKHAARRGCAPSRAPRPRAPARRRGGSCRRAAAAPGEGDVVGRAAPAPREDAEAPARGSLELPRCSTNRCRPSTTVQARVLDLLDEVQARRGTAYLFVSVRHRRDRAHERPRAAPARWRYRGAYSAQ